MRQKENTNNSVLLSHYTDSSVIEKTPSSVPDSVCVSVSNKRTPSVSLLISIQKTVQHFASLLANVLHLEIEVVDHHLLRIAGTDPYGQNFGQIP